MCKALTCASGTPDGERPDRFDRGADQRESSGESLLDAGRIGLFRLRCCVAAVELEGGGGADIKTVTVLIFELLVRVRDVPPGVLLDDLCRGEELCAVRLVWAPLVDHHALHVGLEVHLNARPHLQAAPLLDGNVHPDCLGRFRHGGPRRALIRCRSRRSCALSSDRPRGRNGDEREDQRNERRSFTAPQRLPRSPCSDALPCLPCQPCSGAKCYVVRLPWGPPDSRLCHMLR